MRYELTNYEWSVIRPMLPNKPRACRVWTTGVSSTASFGSRVQVRRGAIFRKASVPTRPAKIASFAGAGPASGTNAGMP